MAHFQKLMCTAIPSFSSNSTSFIQGIPPHSSLIFTNTRYTTAAACSKSTRAYKVIGASGQSKHCCEQKRNNESVVSETRKRQKEKRYATSHRLLPLKLQRFSVTVLAPGFSLSYALEVRGCMHRKHSTKQCSKLVPRIKRPQCNNSNLSST